MKKILPLLVMLISPFLAAMEARLVYMPDVSADRVVFTMEDDLWVAPLTGGPAQRITSHPGIESHAKFSPDGKWLAFSANYDGGDDVYIMPSGGGEPVRLTWHPARDIVTGWSEDGHSVYFVSRRGMETRLYRVGIGGGPPAEFPIPKVWQASVGSGEKEIAYVPTSADRMNWKGYKGGQQQDIYLYAADKGEYKKIIASEGYDNFPMVTSDAVYFDSDREYGRMNLYAYDRTRGAVTRLTPFKDWDVESPSYGHGKIVYVCGGFLWLYDTQSRQNRKLEITVPSDRWQMRDFHIKPGEFVADASPFPDGKKALVEARGDLYVVDTELEKALNLTQSSDSRETAPSVSPDGKTVAFYSDRSGEFELYLMEPRPGAPWTQVTKGSRTFYYHILWSPDSRKLAFEDKDFNLFIADATTKEATKFDRFPYLKDNEIFWEWSDYSWSPDSRYLAYSVVTENMNSALKLYDTKDKKIIVLSDGYDDDFSPSFDANGQLLYFLSQRNFQPQLDPFMDDHIAADTTVACAYLLQDKGPLPFGKEFKAALPKEKAKEITIDFNGLKNRIYRVPMDPGTYRSLQARLNGFVFLSRKNSGFPGLEEFFNPKSAALYTLKSFGLEDEEPAKVADKIGTYALTPDGKKALYLAGKEAGYVDIKGGAKREALTFYGLEHLAQPSKEYAEMYRDLWRQIRDFFYDPKLHGKDWKAVYAKYSALLPYASTRSDLNYLIGQTIGELCASHEYIVGRGGPRRLRYDSTSVGLLGADLAPDPKSGLYQFKRILNGRSDLEDASNPLQAPGIHVEPGTYLLAIDGQSVQASDDYLKFLEGKAGRDVVLRINEKPAAAGAREITVKALTSDYALRYQDWVQKNIRAVSEKTSGKVGYMNLSDMDEEGLKQFDEAFRALRYKQGLIIDVRSNGGGFVSWFVIDKLERKLKYLAQTRDFATMRYPHGVHDGPIVVLADEETGSDGEVFSQHFKDLKLGTLMGQRTWGGLIGIINMVPLLDGGSATQSNVGFADLARNWVVENHGVEPDIEVEQTAARVLNGEDPQLDAAVRLIAQQLEGHPAPLPPPPPYPVK